jgi:deoxyribodipyrimidine photo-lyase
MPAAPLNVVWFKRDLRLCDHAALHAAALAGRVLPIYIAEPELWAQPDASARQWGFAAECLAELQQALTARGAPLRVFTGDAVAVLQTLHRHHKIATLWSHEETGNGWTYARDLRVKDWARRSGVAWHEPRQTGVIRRLASRNGWAKAWDLDMARPQLPTPDALNALPNDWPTTIPDDQSLRLFPDPCPHRQRGGTTSARRILDSFVTERGRGYRFEMSSPVTAFRSCSRLSPHIAWGTMSLREIIQTTSARAANLDPNDAASKPWRASLRSFAARLHWHCHFMQKLEDAPRLEFENLHRGYNGLRPTAPDPVRLAAFVSGQTGYPLVDACLRALDAYGWINFRMRAMLMSFASYHLWLPWRASGLHLARQFVDYEAGIHWPQVQMQSGTTGINAMRVYNPVKQSLDQDPEGRFIRRFVPELATVPDGFIHEPWLWQGAARLAYPPPIVDNKTAAKQAKDALASVRRTGSHGAEAQQIADKHASRKPAPAKPRPKARASDPDQFSLKF